MPTLKIRGVDVEFPFVPYACQQDYMAKVIQCLQEKTNGILESPTGTGKTLCLLCATLAWRQSFIADQQLQSLRRSDTDGVFNSGFGKDLSEDLYNGHGAWGGSDEGMLMEKPRIIYASRTHSQLSQAIQQLKDTSYRPKVCILGSREQLCIHTEVSSQQNNNTMVHMCRAKVGARMCNFHNHLDEKKSDKEFTEGLLDIEDLVKLGQKHKVCPYYMARELKNSADIIFMPYNYLLDPKSRRAHGIELKGHVLIFDEAHNVEKMCEESVSFDFTSYDLASCIDETSKLLEKNVEVESLNQQFNTDSSAVDFDSAELYQLKALFLILEEAIDEIQLPLQGSGITKPGGYIYELLGKAKLTFDTYTQALDLLEKIISHLTNSPTGMFIKTSGLQKFSDILKIVFTNESASGSNQHIALMSKFYKVHFHAEQSNKKKQRNDLWTSNAKPDKSGKTLSCWCFSPGFSMRDLSSQDVRSIVLTSGTLSPLNSFTSELQIKFPIQLENPHVIEKHQMLVGIVTKGPDGTSLNSSYENRSSPNYIKSLGNAIVNYSRTVPNGLLVFFPSYVVMNQCLEMWQESGITSRISQYKAMFVEPKNKAQFNETMQEFYDKINDTSHNGAAFFAVCRGKVSEGLDFADINGRAVVITGLPFPPRMDAKVNLKMKFLDEVKSKTPQESLSGRQWYCQQAYRAVNQAIGRVIRHKEDYGAIILCDNRFAKSDTKAQLPSWVRPYTQTYENFGILMRDLINFFRTTERIMPKPKLKSRESHMTCETTSSKALPVVSKPLVSSFTSASSYSSRTKSVVDDASNIVSHVPSLRKPEKAVYEAKLKIMYENSAGTSINLKTRSLLDALEQDNQMTSEVDDDIINSPQALRYKEALHKRLIEQGKKNSVKKKIVVVNPFLSKEMESKTELSGTTKRKSSNDSKDSTQSSSSTSTIVPAKIYLSKVKDRLTSDAYQRFSELMQQYSKQCDYNQLVSGLVELFLDDQDKHELFRKFYRFVKPCHKKDFDILCKGLTGLGCGYKPEHSLRRDTLKKAKQHGSNGSEMEMKMKKRKRDFEDSSYCSKANKIPMISHSMLSGLNGNGNLDTSTHLSGHEHKSGSVTMACVKPIAKQVIDDSKEVELKDQLESPLKCKISQSFSEQNSSQKAFCMNETVPSQCSPEPSLDTSVSLFSAESSAVDTSIDSVSGSSKKKHKHKKKFVLDDNQICKDSEESFNKIGHSDMQNNLVTGSCKKIKKPKHHKSDHVQPGCMQVSASKKKKKHKHCKKKLTNLNVDADEVENDKFVESESANCSFKSASSTSDETEKVCENDTLSEATWNTHHSVNRRLIDNHVQRSQIKSGIKCGICKNEVIEPFQARCHHVCCKDCWPAYIKEHKSCPKCGAKTKKRHIERAYSLHNMSDSLLQ